MTSWFKWLFGCGCANLSRVFTPRNRPHESYVVCLDCGSEYEYNMATMRIGERIEPQVVGFDSVTQAREWERLRDKAASSDTDLEQQSRAIYRAWKNNT